MASSNRFSAADALHRHCNVTILDATPSGPGGLAGGFRTPILNQPVEAGIHGFWREYTNTLDVLRSLSLEDKVLTRYTPSILISQNGRVALAPVLREDGDGEENRQEQPVASIEMAPLKALSKLLPPPLDIAILSQFSPNSPLNHID